MSPLSQTSTYLPSLIINIYRFVPLCHESKQIYLPCHDCLELSPLSHISTYLPSLEMKTCTFVPLCYGGMYVSLRMLLLYHDYLSLTSWHICLQSCPPCHEGLHICFILFQRSTYLFTLCEYLFKCIYIYISVNSNVPLLFYFQIIKFACSHIEGYLNILVKLLTTQELFTTSLWESDEHQVRSVLSKCDNVQTYEMALICKLIQKIYSFSLLLFMLAN